MKKIVTVVGPTACGKTEYAIEIAKKLNGEIVSCDSMQLYKYMDIGSAKPSIEQRVKVKHYLVDEIDPKTPFSVAEYQKSAKKAIREIFNKSKIPIIVGGTGLYLNSLIYEMDFADTVIDQDFRDKMYKTAEENGSEVLYKKLIEQDPVTAKRIHPNNIKRVIRALEACKDGKRIKSFDNVKTKTKDYDVILTGLTMNRDKLYSRINDRVDILIDMGLDREVKSLIDMGFTSDDISMKGIGYKELIDYFEGKCSFDEAVIRIKTNTRHYAKRQITWFKRYSDMKWFDVTDESNKENSISIMTKWIKERL